ncbi:MAG: hypothetical protein OHK0029_19050 [Armatimonadaceae bacterium]
MVPPFAPDLQALSRALKDAATETLTGGFVLAIPSDSSASKPQTDPRNRWSFPNRLYLYQPGKTTRGSGLNLVLHLHYEAELRDIATITARQAAHLLRLHQERFGFAAKFPRGNTDAHLWVTNREPQTISGLLGGETWNNQVYLYGAGQQINSLEWMRRVAHEWGHLTLPGARGYSEPEGDAAGYLGERVYLKWLHDEALARTVSPQDGIRREDTETYVARQVEPLVARFHKGGPGSPLLRGKRTENMDYYIGAALAFEAAFGGNLLGKALFSINGTAPEDLIPAMEYAVRQALTQRKTVQATLPAWVPLPKQTLLLSADAPGEVALSTRPPLAVGGAFQKPVRLEVQSAGWKWARTVSSNVKKLVLRAA